jgi:hypothetical protein
MELNHVGTPARASKLRIQARGALTCEGRLINAESRARVHTRVRYRCDNESSEIIYSYLCGVRVLEHAQHWHIGSHNDMDFLPYSTENVYKHVHTAGIYRYTE